MKSYIKNKVKSNRASSLRKDKMANVRVSSVIKARLLSEYGWSVQALLDWAIDEKFRGMKKELLEDEESSK